MAITSNIAAWFADICPYGVCLYHHPRHSGRGGGVAFLVPVTYKVKRIHTPQYQSFEVICIVIKHYFLSVSFIRIYRAPPSTNNLFYAFPDFLETTLQFQEDLYMFAYFNIHLDLPSLNTRSFNGCPSNISITCITRFNSYTCSWSLARLVYY